MPGHYTPARHIRWLVRRLDAGRHVRWLVRRHWRAEVEWHADVSQDSIPSGVHAPARKKPGQQIVSKDVQYPARREAVGLKALG
jgi:hypothetical protein